MTEETPKCRTCGYALTLDLNGDYFCLHSVIICEKHDDNYPSPFVTITVKEYEELKGETK